jgi:hypothetical protein
MQGGKNNIKNRLDEYIESKTKQSQNINTHSQKNNNLTQSPHNQKQDVYHHTQNIYNQE